MFLCFVTAMDAYIITVVYSLISFANLDITSELIKRQKEEGILGSLIL